MLDQVFRMLVRSQVVYGLKAMRDRFPEVDLVLIEPEAHDWTMFNYHPMRYSVRERIARHAFDQTRDRLVRDADELERVFARHGLDFDPSRLTAGRSRRRAARPVAGRILRGLEKIPGLRSFAETPVGTPDPF